MGFIDYQGTKEDRYSEVLEFAKAQQEEEARRIEDIRVGKWVSKTLGDARYAGLTIEDLMKYILVRYKNLEELKNKLFVGKSLVEPIDSEILWKDLCSALVAKRLEAFGLEEEKENTYYETFLKKVFKLSEYTGADIHYDSMMTNESYSLYFSDCFDLVQEKQFWKLLGQVSSAENQTLQELVDRYDQLSVLIGYYLYQGLRPGNSLWRQRLEVEHQALEKLKNDYKLGRMKEPNYTKLINPLYKPEVVPKEPEDSSCNSRTAISSRLDKAKFKECLEEKTLESYSEACRLLRACELPEAMDELYGKIFERIPVLRESLEKFEDIYQPDLYQFYEYYFPECLQLTATYVEYMAVSIGESILKETEEEILEAANKILLSINAIIDEIYRFASMEVKARAKALEAIMSQDGYVDPNFKF